MSLAPMLLRVSVGALACVAGSDGRQKPGCDAIEPSWCVERATLGPDGLLEIACRWFGPGLKPSDADNRSLYLVDDAGRRYDHVATSGAATYGSRPVSGGAPGRVFFPAPRRGALLFTLRDDARGRAITGIVLEPPPPPQGAASRAVLRPLAGADAFELSEAGDGRAFWRDRRTLVSRQGEAFVGESTTRQRAGSAPETTRPVRLDAAHVDAILAVLAGSELVPSEPLARADADPNRALQTSEVAVTSGGERFVFEMRPRERHRWVLRTDARPFGVTSDHPGRAFSLLRGLLDGRPPPPPQDVVPIGSDDLRLAAQLGDVVRVERILARRPDRASLDARTPFDGETPLTAATRWSRSESVRRLLDAGADPALRNAAGGSPLAIAALAADTDVVTLLAERHGPTRPLDTAALTNAAVAESIGCARALVAGRTLAGLDTAEALDHAARANATEMIRLLIGAGAAVDGATPSGGRALIAAIEHGHLEATQALLAAGADARAADKGGWTALHRAAGMGHTDVMEALLRAGADPGAATAKGETPLFFVHGPAAATWLVRAGARVDARRHDGATPIAALAGIRGGWHWNSRHARREPVAPDTPGLVEALLEAGADVDAPDATGRTALQRATGRTALPRAADALLSESNRALAVLVLARGADPNRADTDGRAPLWHAIAYYVKHRRGRGPEFATPVVEALLRAGARDQPDSKGVRPSDLAREVGLTELADRLARPIE